MIYAYPGSKDIKTLNNNNSKLGKNPKITTGTMAYTSIYMALQLQRKKESLLSRK